MTHLFKYVTWISTKKCNFCVHSCWETELFLWHSFPNLPSLENLNLSFRHQQIDGPTQIHVHVQHLVSSCFPSPSAPQHPQMDYTTLNILRTVLIDVFLRNPDVPSRYENLIIQWNISFVRLKIFYYCPGTPSFQNTVLALQKCNLLKKKYGKLAINR